MRLFLWVLLFPSFLSGQVNVEGQVSDPVSNNAVAGIKIGDTAWIFSFSGIDASRRLSGIHARTYAWNPSLDTALTLEDLPGAQGRIAAGASVVKGKIYIAGGYEVFQDGSENSLDELHVFDPYSFEFEPDAKDIPIRIDDHVQVVWRDSLIYLITGWSQDRNVRAVQIYNPTLNEWQVGTSTPSSFNFMVFGASGCIVNDTIYYLGGAAFGSSFPLRPAFRKGAINPDSPQEIEWSFELLDQAILYRSACVTDGRKIYWIGGSGVSYNYNGIAYNGTGPVSPLDQVIVYNPQDGSLQRHFLEGLNTMDLRSAAFFSEDSIYLFGGMSEGPIVSDKIKRIQVKSLVSDDNLAIVKPVVRIFPNPCVHELRIQGKADGYRLINLEGKLLKEGNVTDTIIDVSNINESRFIIELTHLGQPVLSQIIVKLEDE